jgi:hypothetical protein
MTIEKAFKDPDLVERAMRVHSVWKANGGVRDWREWKANGGLEGLKSGAVYRKCFTDETHIRSAFNCNDGTIDQMIRKTRRVERFIIEVGGGLEK